MFCVFYPTHIFKLLSEISYTGVKWNANCGKVKLLLNFDTKTLR
jgi:hypothetical protein